MVVFYAVAAAMIVFAVLVAIAPLILRRRSSESDDAALNVALVKDRLKELKKEREEGLVTESEYDTAKEELEARVLRESQTSVDQRSQGPRWVAAVVVVTVPALAFALYAQLGTPGLIDRPTSPDRQQTAEKGDAERGREILEERVERLKALVEEEPENVDAWSQLGRYHAMLRSWPQAREAFSRATELAGEARPDLMVDYAEMLIMSNSDEFTAQARSMLDRAMELDPQNEKGRWLLGMSRFQAREYQAAADIWQGLLDEMPKESRQGQLLRRYVQIANARAGGGANEQPAPASGGGAGVTARIEVDPALNERIAPGDSVFIFARAPEGPPMPIAAVKRSAGELPFEVELTDEDAMTGNRKLSDFETVELVVRVSKSGGPRAQSGDLEGSVSTPIGGEDPVKVRIDRVVN